MKIKHWFFMLLLCAAGFLTFIIMPLPARFVSSITVVDHNRPLRENLKLDQNQAQSLIDSLQGSRKDSMPKENPAGVFDLTVSMKGILRRSYKIYITEEREVYVRQPLTNRLVLAANPVFFLTSEAFASIYPYSIMPEVQVTVNNEKLFPRVINRRWQYVKGEYGQSEGRLPYLESQADAPPVLRNLENSLVISADPFPASINLSVTGPSEKIVFEGCLAAGELPLFYRNGNYEYRLRLAWEDEAGRFEGEYEAVFSIMLDLPPVFEIPETAYQGELIAFYAHNIPAGRPPVLRMDKNEQFEFYPYEGGYVAYLPTHYGTSTGEHQVFYGLDEEQLSTGVLNIKPREFQIQHLKVAAEVVESTSSDAAYRQYNRYFPEARSVSSEHRYYEESFIVPVFGKLTTEFGEARYVNNASTSTRHSGLDIAAPTGTPVSAVNRGRVSLAMELTLTGNTLVIDHGQGLFSVYYHLNELFVEKGRLVDRGSTVGTVGSTGFSTGPHLHFTMSYYKHNLEPGYLLVGEAITYENASLHLQPQTPKS